MLKAHILCVGFSIKLDFLGMKEEIYYKNFIILHQTKSLVLQNGNQKSFLRTTYD